MVDFAIPDRVKQEEAVGLHLGKSLSSEAKQSMCLQSLQFLWCSFRRADYRRLEKSIQEEPHSFRLLLSR